MKIKYSEIYEEENFPLYNNGKYYLESVLSEYPLHSLNYTNLKYFIIIKDMTEICCLLVDKVEYLEIEFDINPDSHIEKQFKLSEEEKRMLMNILNSKSEYCQDMTVWESMFMYNNESLDIDIPDAWSEVLPIPDYTQIK